MTKKNLSKETKPRAEPFGRPTKYDPKYCEMLVKHMASGLSFESFSAVIDVTISTLYEWDKNQPDFSEAKKTAFAKNLHFWEKTGVEGLYDQMQYNDQGKPIHKKSLNATVWIFNMKNRHRWRDRQEIELEANVTTSPLKEEMKKKSTEELLEIVKKGKEE